MFLEHPADRILGEHDVVLLSGAEPGDYEPGVELRQLRHFVSVAEELHFGRAASRLFISQPGLSQSIARLERALGVQLLQRSRRGVQLTDAGLELLHHARRLLADTEDALERVRSVGQGQAGVLRAGVALLAEHVIAPALAAFHAEHPGVALDRTAAVSERLLAQLSDGGLQVAFVHQVPALTGLARVEWEVVRRGRLAVLMSRHNPLATRDTIALHELSKETFLVNPRELAPSAFQGLKLMCAEFGGFDPKVTESAAASTPTLDPDWLPIRQAEAIAVVAEETASAICPPDVAVVPLSPPPRSAIAVAWRHADRTALLERFLCFIRGYRDAHGWVADTPRLSPGRKHLLDASPPGRFPLTSQTRRPRRSDREPQQTGNHRRWAYRREHRPPGRTGRLRRDRELRP